MGCGQLRSSLSPRGPRTGTNPGERATLPRDLISSLLEGCWSCWRTREIWVSAESREVARDWPEPACPGMLGSAGVHGSPLGGLEREPSGRQGVALTPRFYLQGASLGQPFNLSRPQFPPT